ncbi:MAG TPA: VPDSG-CTERM sorting domain-containing protein [Opitutaceae bacterium]|nr:VPDSG-CTERM sorting domain-containing protein [Opitutaceae bacterium]
MRTIPAMLVTALCCAVGQLLHAQSVLFNYTGSITDYTVSTTGIYKFTVAGAQGGSIPYAGYYGGNGALLSGDLYLTAGQTLKLAVGGVGALGGEPGVSGDAPGGGGGSFVVLNTGSILTPLVIAGGGGGAGYYGSGGGAGQAGTSGGNGHGTHGGAGGTNGNGGLNSQYFYQWPSNNQSGGGAGFYTNGASAESVPGVYEPYSGAGGYSFLNGLAGGVGANGAGAGGFGGGGSGGNEYGGNGGGGGGYSGGGGGDISNGGGGGGSYFTTDTAFLPVQIQGLSGAQSGNGFIQMDLVRAGAVPDGGETAVLLLMAFGALVVVRRRTRRSLDV